MGEEIKKREELKRKDEPEFGWLVFQATSNILRRYYKFWFLSTKQEIRSKI